MKAYAKLPIYIRIEFTLFAHSAFAESLPDPMLNKSMNGEEKKIICRSSFGSQGD